MCEKCGDDNCDGSNDYIDPVDIITELYPNKKFYYLDDFNEAIVGIVGNKLAYSKSVIIDILCYEEEMTSKEALKYYENNIENAYYGEQTPIFINDDLSAIINDIYDETDNGIISIPFSVN